MMRRSRVLFFTVIIVCVFSVVTLIPQQAAAWPPQGLQVSGHVYDVSGNPVTDARVLVTIEETGFSREDWTDSAGYYRTDPEFNDTDWDLDYTIHVESWSTSLGYQDNSTTVDQDIYDFGMAEIDVNYTTAIAEFGSLAGAFVAIVASGLVGLVLVGRRKSK